VFRLKLLLCALTLSFSSSGWASTGDDFDNGLTASKEGDYRTALSHFTNAHNAGLNTPVLLYNLGVVQYKLGNYSESKSYFSRIVRDAKWGPLAEYNLGLLSEKVGQDVQARTHYREAANRATTPKLRQLANSKITTRPTRSTRSDDSWISYSSLASGIDDNVLLADDALLSAVSDEEDYFVDLVGAASQFVSGDYADGWRLDLMGYYRAYSDLDEFDFGLVSAGMVYNRLIDGWHVQAGVKAGAQFTGGDAFTSGGTFRLRAYHKIGQVGLRLTNDFSLIEGASDYDYLSGTQNRTSLELIRSLDDTRIRVGYQFDYNDRDDLSLTSEFFSYSPTRHRVFAAVEQSFSEKLSAEVRVSLRNSEYDDDNIEIEPDSSVTQEARDEDRLGAKIRVGYRITDRWRLFGEYQYTDNDANFDRYNYDSNLYMLGIERTR
jgi:hypothetical protein